MTTVLSGIMIPFPQQIQINTMIQLPLLITLTLLVTSSTKVASIEPPLPIYTELYSFNISQSQGSHLQYHQTPDNSRVIVFYAEIYKPPYVFDFYTHSFIQKIDFYLPSSLQRVFFMGEDNLPAAIYTNFSDNITLRRYTNNYDDYRDDIVGDFHCQQSTKVAVSTDGKLWAASCQANQQVLIGKVNDTDKPPQTVFIDSLASRIAWRLHSQELIVLAFMKSPPQNTLITLINAYTLNKQIIINQSGLSIYSLAFSPVGDLLLHDNNKVYAFNLTSRQNISYQADQLGGISMHGSFLMRSVLITEPSYHYWQHYYRMDQENFMTNTSLFRVPVNWPSKGITQTSTHLYAQTAKNQYGSTLTIYKLCNVQGWFYNELNNQCQLCHQSCLNCLFGSNNCVKCQNESYYMEQGSRSCQLCSKTINFCITCSDESACLTCQNGYALSPISNKCQLCSSFMEGCNICESIARCTECQDSYIRQNYQCLRCYTMIIGCLICHDPIKCSQCQAGFDLDSITYKCVQKQDHTWIILITVLGGLVVVAVIAILLIKRHKRRQKGRGRKEESESRYKWIDGRGSLKNSSLLIEDHEPIPEMILLD